MLLVSVNPDRYADNGRVGVAIKGVVVHTTEGSEDDGGVRTYLTMKGDRPTKSGGVYGSSYDAQALSDGTWVEFKLGAEGDGSPYAAPPLNRSFLHIVIPGKSAQFDDPDGWRDDFSKGCIDAVAAYIVEAARQHGFPLVKLEPAEMAAAGPDNVTGYCGHGDVSQAWPDGGSEGHSDPGPHFPWGLLADEIGKTIGAAASPPPQTGAFIMWTIFDIVGTDASFLVALDAHGIGGTATWLPTPQVRQAHVDAGAPVERRQVAELANLTLISPIPRGDRFHDWTGSEFLHARV